MNNVDTCNSLLFDMVTCNLCH